MKTKKVFISENVDGNTYYVSTEIEVPGIGTIEMKDTVSLKTIERLFEEVETNCRLKIQGRIQEISS